MHAVLTRSDLRWMDEQRRHAALRRAFGATEGEPAAMAPRREEAEKKPGLPAGDDSAD